MGIRIYMYMCMYMYIHCLIGCGQGKLNSQYKWILHGHLGIQNIHVHVYTIYPLSDRFPHTMYNIMYMYMFFCRWICGAYKYMYIHVHVYSCVVYVVLHLTKGHYYASKVCTCTILNTWYTIVKH